MWSTRGSRTVRTDIGRLDFDALFDVSGLGTVRVLVIEDFRLAKSVDKGGAAGSRATCAGVKVEKKRSVHFATDEEMKND